MFPAKARRIFISNFDQNCQQSKILTHDFPLLPDQIANKPNSIRFFFTPLSCPPCLSLWLNRHPQTTKHLSDRLFFRERMNKNAETHLLAFLYYSAIQTTQRSWWRGRGGRESRHVILPSVGFPPSFQWIFHGDKLDSKHNPICISKETVHSSVCSFEVKGDSWGYGSIL